MTYRLLIEILGTVTDKAVVRPIGYYNLEVRVPDSLKEKVATVLHNKLPYPYRGVVKPLGYEEEYTTRITIFDR